MTDDDTQARTRGLLGTDDAMVWAEEFVRIFEGQIVSDENEAVNVGLMVAWFANAMQTAIYLHEERKRQATVAQKEAFVEGFQEGRPEEV
jgi:hypothetical protein